MTNRANKGGEFGINGQWYDGGQYLPSSPFTVKGEFSQSQPTRESKPRKQEIAPYEWVASTRKAIWGMVGVGAYTRYDGQRGKLETVETTNFWKNAPEQKQREIRELVSRWNNGERWV